MFERIRISEPARRVVVLAQDEARSLGHSFIGLEHLLLGLLRGESHASEALEGLGVRYEAVRAEVERMVEPRPEAGVGQIPFTPPSLQALKDALREARSLNHSVAGPEHILLALLKRRRGLAATILVRVGAERETVRAEVLRLHPPEAPAIPGPAERLWSYRVVRAGQIEADALNEAAGEGWKLVSAVGEPGDFRLVFKRLR